MKILKCGSDIAINEEFVFKCRCGAIWSAKRKEVHFTPPFLPYDVYMECPYCNETRYISENKDIKDYECYVDSEGYERCGHCNEHETGMRYYTFCPRCGVRLKHERCE